MRWNAFDHTGCGEAPGTAGTRFVGWSDEEVENHLVAVHRAIAAAHVALCEAVAELDRRGVPTAGGARRLADWLTG